MCRVFAVLVAYYLRAQKISSTFLKKFSAKFKKSKQRNSEGYKIGVFTGYYLEGLLFSKLFSSKPEKIPNLILEGGRVLAVLAASLLRG